MCFIGFVLGLICRWISFFNLFTKLESQKGIYSLIQEALQSGKAVIIFLNNGRIFVGVPMACDTTSKGIQSIELMVLISGYKKEGIAHYTRIARSPIEKTIRTFSTNHFESIGFFELDTLVYFLKAKPSDKRTNVEQEIIKDMVNQNDEAEN